MRWTTPYARGHGRSSVWRSISTSAPNDVRALSRNDVDAVLAWLAAFPEDGHGQVWLEAYEDGYRRALLGTLAAGRGAGRQGAERPRAQIVLCIDVRSESFRRHIEAAGPYETFGYAGFFGVAMDHAAFDSGERFPLCPVLLTPQHAVDEVVRAGPASTPCRPTRRARGGNSSARTSSTT